MDEVFKEHLQILSIILGVIIAMITIWKKAQLGNLIVTGWQKTFGRHHHTIITQMQQQKAVQDEIWEQVKPNGYGSMQNQLHDIKEHLEDNTALTGAKMNADHQAMFITDADGKVIKNNRQHQILTGFSIEQLCGDGWVNVIHPDDRVMVHNKWEEAVSEEREFSEVIRYITPSNETYNVRVEVYKQLDSKNRIRGYLGVVHPLGEQDVLHHTRVSGTL